MATKNLSNISDFRESSALFCAVVEMQKRNKEEEDTAEAVANFVREEVSDWDDEIKCRARFKALSGQRSDWESTYLFWRDLIVKVARHLRILVICPSHVQSLWFQRNGLSPLCLPNVLEEMHRAGELLPQSSVAYQTTAISRLSYLFRKPLDFFVSRSFSNDSDHSLADDYFILSPLLEERSLEVVKILSENHWTSSCVVTLRKFQTICRGSKEAQAILSYLSAQGKAKYFIINSTEKMEGVKVSIALGTFSSVSDVDYSILHLIWTAENLVQQLYGIDQRYEVTRNLALDSLKSRNNKTALRYARELKQTSLCREKCSTLLERVENVVQVIADAESSKMVTEAIKYSNHAIRANQINVEEVELCLREIDENIRSMKQIDNAIESASEYAEVDDADVEDEFNRLQMEFNREMRPSSTENGNDIYSSVQEVPSSDLLANAMSNLYLTDGATMVSDSDSRENPVSKQNLEKVPA